MAGWGGLTQPFPPPPGPSPSRPPHAQAHPTPRAAAAARRRAPAPPWPLPVPARKDAQRGPFRGGQVPGQPPALVTSEVCFFPRLLRETEALAGLSLPGCQAVSPAGVVAPLSPLSSTKRPRLRTGGRLSRGGWRWARGSPGLSPRRPPAGAALLCRGRVSPVG